jgi:2-C-methyl-D-erythritol 4-phosphate cytidylyltransferase/2-C-methyl-D-erythritol 2,4-cyclodiphosphate synthase
MSVAAIVVAGGRGTRLGGDVPKQFADLGGLTMLARSVAPFDAHPAVGEIIVVLPEEFVADGATMVGPTSRPCRFTAGGAHRHDSVRAGAALLSDAATVVLIHDAARPFADAALIDRVIDATQATGAAIPATAARETLKRVRTGAREIVETIPRSEIWLAQTPQGFTRSVLNDVIARGASDRAATDEAMLAEAAGHRVTVVDGDERNVKVTTADDLADARARILGPPRVGTGYDLHRLVDGRALVLAGVRLPSTVGPLGHSDGDVVCHALVDAMLGAAGAGDIGQHFPNTDPRWKDAAGLDLLGRANAILRERGWTLSSADVTVILERPKIAPHLAAIREALAATIGVTAAQVSVKGKTNEGVDATGRGEAIAAHAVAVIVSGGRR